MCLIAFALHAHPSYRLVLAANRDEFHARPTAAADFHEDDTDVYGGRDLRAGGSWLSVSRRGRVVAVTNVRAGVPESGRRSRGDLVHGFVRSRAPITDDIARLQGEAAAFGRFNLLAFDGNAMHALGNHPAFRAERVTAGVHAISNAALDLPWPKTRALHNAMTRWAGRGETDPAPLFAALHDDRIAADHDLPDTGVGLAIERRLSAAFIRGTEYGTRASTVVLVDDHRLQCIERRFGLEGVPAGESDVRFAIDA
jgi:uncharacterized protein with NRDE domain